MSSLIAREAVVPRPLDLLGLLPAAQPAPVPRKCPPSVSYHQAAHTGRLNTTAQTATATPPSNPTKTEAAGDPAPLRSGRIVDQYGVDTLPVEHRPPLPSAIAPRPCREQPFQPRAYTAWPSLRLSVPATAKQPRSDFPLAFVAGVGGGALQPPDAHPARHTVKAPAPTPDSTSPPSAIRQRSTTNGANHPPLDQINFDPRHPGHTTRHWSVQTLHRLQFYSPCLFECLNHSTQSLQSTNYRNRTSGAMVKPCCSFNQIPRPRYNSLPLCVGPR